VYSTPCAGAAQDLPLWIIPNKALSLSLSLSLPPPPPPPRPPGPRPRPVRPDGLRVKRLSGISVVPARTVVKVRPRQSVSRLRLFQRHLRSLVWVWVWVWDWIHSHTPPRTRSPSSRHPPFTHYPFPPRSLVCRGQPSPHKPRLVVSHSTCPPLSSSPHAHSFVLGTAVINTHTSVLSHLRARSTPGDSLIPTGRMPCLSNGNGPTSRSCLISRARALWCFGS
jgi:hypothetical protein